jgi:hypothetical protein
MNWTIVRYIALVAWCMSTMGCTICQLARRTIWQEPAAYSWKHDRRRSSETYLQWANAELAEQASRCPDLFGDPDYVMGFRDGFIDFVWAGGTGEPPPVPPRQFWNVMLRSPDGKVRAELWFDGYRHGSAVARDGGYRDLGRVHSSLVGYAHGAQHLTFPPAMDGMPALDPPQQWQDGEVLPDPPFAAPSLPPPFKIDNTPAQESAATPAEESAPTSIPASEDTPFQDDPQRTPAETDDQPLSLDAATPAQHVYPQQEVPAQNEALLHEAEAGEFDVLRAILVKGDHDDATPNESYSTNHRPASTVKFAVESSDGEANSASTNFHRAAHRQVNRHNFRGWTRSGAPESASSSKLRVLQE